MPGPAAAIPTPEPTKSPAPMAPPSASIARCLRRSPCAVTRPVMFPPLSRTTSGILSRRRPGGQSGTGR
ncbi:hypothetical protein Shyd_43990 [Streptomyces hydrogenans]|uniref:Uncharacterized protein n=1 Tax=Streptomyces hydrogenans TaxID=1873719 RepID=A0ABQ3PDE3_9ACTN|nr:hypothetical protein GCM10018784_76790 [Streptomyces hydrogenans]GHI23028.1 hypothetical protein Shyd_43990 [Streptomyces hydrogenans]